jgi:serine/threonine protein kinase
MTTLSDAAIERLRHLGAWPEFESGRYAVIEKIGHGGMGTVYLAMDEELGREVAIKIPNAIETARLDRRFQIEARALARLEHPGIVPIHDMGRLADGRLFYVMKRVQGRTLRDHLSSISDMTERLRIFERLCEPVRFAHAQGVIHRDLKPENVMVGAYGEVMVMDWGAAKTTAADPQRSTDDAPAIGAADDASASLPPDGRTSHGVVIGTRGFMAPEQARGESAGVDVRADVYSLGAILYFLTTQILRPPCGAIACRGRSPRFARPRSPEIPAIVTRRSRRWPTTWPAIVRRGRCASIARPRSSAASGSSARIAHRSCSSPATLRCARSSRSLRGGRGTVNERAGRRNRWMEGSV